MNMIDEQKKKKKRYHLYIFLLILLVILVIIILIASDVNAEDSTIRITPSETTMYAGDTTLLSLSCMPGQSIKSFECDLSFNASLLSINDVYIGTLFSGFETYSSLGSIDNTNGSITNIYCVIKGNGSVNTTGTLVILNCSANTIESNQTSRIQITRIGVTNETEYLPVEITNGTVNVEPVFTLSSIYPANNSESISLDTTSINVTLTHAKGYTINGSITTNPDIGLCSFSILNQTIQCNITNLASDTSYTWILTYTDGINNLTNTYNFQTEYVTTSTPQPPSGGGFQPPIAPPVEEEPSENHAPETPIILQSNDAVELGNMYQLCCSSWDIDNNPICIIIDWGDASEQNISAFFNANETICMQHRWTEPGEYLVTITAQDNHTVPSNSSSTLTIAVQELESNTTQPVSNESHTVIQQENTSLITLHLSNVTEYSLEDIQSVTWDFGDGVVITDINPTYLYDHLGEHQVKISILLTNGESVTKTMTISLSSEGEITITEPMETEQSISWSLLLIGMICAICIGFFVVISVHIHSK